jgi:hypothetical protein
MKNIYTSLSFVIIVLFTSCSFTKYPQSYTSESSDVTYQQFYNDLSPYGDWVDYQNYGYVWVPGETGFRPYYNNGHWLYTDYGWTWVSNYNWGWAPFHYGRWLYDYAYGWMWVPGYQWAPAWVSWRSGDDYYGWAPLGPGMDINSNYGSNIPYDNWSFVPARYINSPQINNYYVNRQQNVTIINNSTIINNTRVINNNNVYITGPSADEVERNTHQKINPIKIVQRNKPGDAQVSGDKLTMYKPAIKDVPQETRSIKPPKLSNLNDVKLRHERTDGGNNQVPASNGNKELNPVNRMQEPANTQKSNPPLIINHQKEIGPPQKTNSDQKVQSNPGDVKKDNSVQDNERLNNEKENQQRIQQNAETERLNREKENQQHAQQGNNNLPAEKPQPHKQNIDKKNDQSNSRRFQTPNSNPTPPVKNNPPAKVRDRNQPNDNPVNRRVIKPETNNARQQNNIQPVQKNTPANKFPANNQPPRINENSRVILPPHVNPQKKDKEE